MPKYTNAGITKYHENGSSNQHYRGWSIKGLNRYNEFFKRVQDDRNRTHASQWEEFFQKVKENLLYSNHPNKKKNCHNDNDKFQSIKISHELWHTTSIEAEDEEI